MNALVNPYYTLTVVPKVVAEKLKLPITNFRAVLTNSGRVVLPESIVKVRAFGQEVYTKVLIADFVDTVIIGYLTLEELGLGFDAVTGSLKPKPPYIPVYLGDGAGYWEMLN